MFTIKNSEQNTFYTGRSRKIPKSKHKEPEFSSDASRSKIYRKLSHARCARNNMGSSVRAHGKMSNIVILEYSAECIAEH